jgi:hypothetical protein
MFDPTVVQICTPSSTREDDALKGKWVRIERNLNREGGMWNLVGFCAFDMSHCISWLSQNLYYRRTRRLDVPLIIDLRLLHSHETPSPLDPSWHKVPRSIRDGVMHSPPLFLWYRTGKTMRDMSPKEKQEDLVTELDVLYGADRPWYGFESLDVPVTPEREGRIEGAWLTYRRGVRRT